MPCYSSLNNYLLPPPIPKSQTSITPPALTSMSPLSSNTFSEVTTSGSGKPTSAVVNVVFALQYPLLADQGLAAGAKIGIGVGAGVGGLAVIGLGVLICRRRKHNKVNKTPIAALDVMPGSTAKMEATGGTRSAPGQNQNFMQPVFSQPYVQKQSNFVPQGAYSPPQRQKVQQGHYYPEMEGTSLSFYRR